MVSIETKDLSDRMNRRIEALLANPHAGSACFKFNHPDAVYVSNCHGTTLYVFDLAKDRRHPEVYDAMEVEKTMQTEFVPSDRFLPGELVSFYYKEGGKDILYHTGVKLNDRDRIFHQSGSGGLFEIKAIEDQRRLSHIIFQTEINVRSFRRK
ncbi:hypothetical protein KA107_03700 [Candidatus Pacearchaeota archaeon]|nr:hypothetical protein [Candidatus Pacearchaeota archaeon]